MFVLEDLPVEILQQIISHFSSASSVINLSLGNKALHQKLSADNYAIFRVFVQELFPSISTPSLWREAACALTSRSRAWDRRALVARECVPPRDETWNPHRLLGSQQSFGYAPVIDSYQTFLGSRWTDGKEVLAWGAAGRLRTRVTKQGSVTWITSKTEDDHLPDRDILDIRLLGPDQVSNVEGESVVIRRANKEIIKLDATAKSDLYQPSALYNTQSDHVDCIDITKSAVPILAVCNAQCIKVYPVHSSSYNVLPSDVCQLDQAYTLKHRKRTAKFLSDTTLAVALQYLDGREYSVITIYDVSPTGLSSTPLSAMRSVSPSSRYSVAGRHCANTLATLDPTSSLTTRPGQVFLSGWSDGVVRLHDLREPDSTRTEYIDVVDDGQILSILPVGHERFLAGSHQNSCLKVFDLRMTGGRVYSYLNAPPPRSQRSQTKPPSPPPPTSRTKSTNQREINIFLAVHAPKHQHTWSPLPTPSPSNHQLMNNLPRYRGSIYSLSSPSPFSPTVYAGIENHVIQLDFASTDDILNPSRFNLNSSQILPTLTSTSYSHRDQQSNSTATDSATGTGNPLSLSAYERPRPGHESTDPVLLRKQLDWHELTSPEAAAAAAAAFTAPTRSKPAGEAEEGWDMRWRLATYERESRSGGAGAGQVRGTGDSRANGGWRGRGGGGGGRRGGRRGA